MSFRARAAGRRLGRTSSRHASRATRGKGNSLRIKPRRLPKEPTLNELLAAKRAFPPGYLHESWVDYLYWDAQLDA
jgi:hypothetical protein